MIGGYQRLSLRVQEMSEGRQKINFQLIWKILSGYEIGIQFGNSSQKFKIQILFYLFHC